MLVDLLEYHRPSQMGEAASLLARERPRTVPLAGATALGGGQAVGVEAVVDLGGLGLDFIRIEADGLSIGAMTTLQGLVENRASRAFWWGVIAASARSSATRVLRNAATVGGTLAAGPLSRADLAAVLLALDARVRVLGLDGRERWLAMAECADGLPGAGVIVEVRVPNPDRSGGTQSPARAAGAAFLRVGRTASDPALVHVAATVEPVPDGGYAVRLAVGGVGWAPVRAAAVETALRGTELAEDTVSQALEGDLGVPPPPSDFRASSRYRGAVIRVLARRAIRQAADRAVTDHLHPSLTGAG
ncbi:MAG: FAD binding domain-containing protein [Candidatus Dormibacteria bacterium]